MADCNYETQNYVYVFEFKLDGLAEVVLQQIESEAYAKEYATDSRKIHCLGINFSSETGHIDEREEKQMK